MDGTWRGGRRRTGLHAAGLLWTLMRKQACCSGETASELAGQMRVEGLAGERGWTQAG